MSDYHIKRTKEILKQIIYATVATASKDAKPWNSPVAYFCDEDLNIYWFSDKESTHSQNIRDNSRVFIVVYDSTMEEGTGEAVYFEAEAFEINDTKEARRIASLQTGTLTMQPEQCLGEAGHRFYKAVPINAWMNDEEKGEDGNYLRDIRVGVSLDLIKTEMRQLK